MSNWKDMNTITSLPAPPPEKPWYESKTIWFNAVTTIVGLAGVVPHPAAMAIAGIGNVVLRTWFTESKIK